MAVADASKLLADLRDSLARHDKPVAFLFGAGTSCCVASPGVGGPLIPTVAGLTKLCANSVEAVSDEFKSAWKRLEENSSEAGLPPHIENLLSRIRIIVRALGKNDELLGLKRTELWKMEELVRKTIAKTVNPDISALPLDTPHNAFARWVLKATRKHPIEVFTVNYDILLEHALEAERVPYFDGFVGGYRPFFLPESLRRIELSPGPAWSRLWKIHGSVNWARISIGGSARVIKTPPSDTGEMILPSFEKYDESRQQPYAAYLDRLRRFLEQDNALLVTSGFSFGDDHINSVIFEILGNRPRTHVYACHFSDLPGDSPILSRASVLRNLSVFTPSQAVLGGVFHTWQSSDDIDIHGMFTRDPATLSDPKPLSGRMALGDFVVFCRFLETFA